MMPNNSLNKPRFRCTICRAPGIFLTPHGLMCHQDALAATIQQERALDHGPHRDADKDPEVTAGL